MRVFVSAAGGFIGRHLTASLVRDGHEVHTIARSSERAAIVRALGAHVVEGDLRDAAAVTAAMRGCDVVHHLATVRIGAAVDRLRRDPTARAGFEADVQATETVVRAAVEHGVRQLVYASSAGVHGTLRRVPADESHPLQPDTAHRRAKLEGERIVRRAAAEHGMSAVIARLTSVYGPYDRAATRFFHGILAGRFRLVGAGEVPYHYTFVDDIVAGLRLCELHRSEADVFLVGTDEIPSLREFFEAIAAAAGVNLRRHPVPIAVFAAAARLSRTFLVPLGVRPRVIRNVEFFTLPRAYDVSRAKHVLGFQPQVSLEEGVRRTMDWVRAGGAAHQA